jgi:hypothetical protein
MLQKFKHKYIINCEESFHSALSGKLIMILEYCEFGDLTGQITQWNEPIREDYVIQVLV